MHRLRAAEHPRPDYVLLHISDTHLIGGDRRLYGAVDADDRLGELLEQLNQSGLRPDAIVFTGDLADKGEPAAYRKLRGLVEPFAAQLGAELVWVMGNHDDRAELRKFLLDEAPSMAPLDRVCMIDGLRIIVLDTSVPGHHHGEIRASQLGWLAEELATPAPDGTILALHHPPIPSVLDMAVTVELRDQAALGRVLRGTDVRAILAGHLHYSTNATFVGIPVSVASATCYTQDLTVAAGGNAWQRRRPRLQPGARLSGHRRAFGDSAGRRRNGRHLCLTRAGATQNRRERHFHRTVASRFAIQAPSDGADVLGTAKSRRLTSAAIFSQGAGIGK